MTPTLKEQLVNVYLTTTTLNAAERGCRESVLRILQHLTGLCADTRLLTTETIMEGAINDAGHLRKQWGELAYLADQCQTALVQLSTTMQKEDDHV